MDDFIRAVSQQETQLKDDESTPTDLLYGQLPFDDDTAVFYISKAHWSNRFDPNRIETVGIFFSLWTTLKLCEEKRFSYNIHSLKLRKLANYELKSRQFAIDFRAAVENEMAFWPNASMGYGPLTLMEGWDTYTQRNATEKVAARIRSFINIVPIIDNLLLHSSKA